MSIRTRKREEFGLCFFPGRTDWRAVLVTLLISGGMPIPTDMALSAFDGPIPFSLFQANEAPKIVEVRARLATQKHADKTEKN